MCNVYVLICLSLSHIISKYKVKETEEEEKERLANREQKLHRSDKFVYQREGLLSHM